MPRVLAKRQAKPGISGLELSVDDRESGRETVGSIVTHSCSARTGTFSYALYRFHLIPLSKELNASRKQLIFSRGRYFDLEYFGQTVKEFLSLYPNTQ